MSVNHLISDFILRLNVAAKCRFTSITVLNSRVLLDITWLLYNNGVIRGFFIDRSLAQVTLKNLVIYLKYDERLPLFVRLKVLSKPSQRIHFTLRGLHLYMTNRVFSGFTIMSTDRGLLTSGDCFLLHRVGGEALVEVSA